MDRSQAHLDQTLIAEVKTAYQRYIDGFMNSDTAAIDAVVQYPLAYIGNGVVTMYDAFPIQPAELMARTGWHDTLGIDYEVVAVSPGKAHVVLRSGTRVRRDGSAIEEIRGFYAWTRTSEGWKIFAVSDITFPA